MSRVLQTVVIIAAAALAGMINSIAGGGTLLSFPALLWIGRDPVMANATNTIALWPASLAGVMGFRDDLRRVRRWLFWLALPSLAGGILGAVLLLHTSSKTFSHLVPFLILGATLLLASQELITRRLKALSRSDTHSRRWIAAAFAFQFLVGIYGGYFGAGIGILMLAALGLMGLTDMHEMNGLKNLLAICINGVAAIYFASSHAVNWHDAAIMAAASIAGGFFGARLAKRLGRRFVRVFVVVIGLFMSVAMFFRH
jgi:uncharacterized membrane protein YfcA